MHLQGHIKCVASGKLEYFSSVGTKWENTADPHWDLRKILILDFPVDILSSQNTSINHPESLSVSVHRLRGGGMVSPQPVTTLGRRWRPGREGRGSAWAGRVPGRWFSIRTPRVSASRYATSSFTLQSPPCTPTSR